MNEVAGQIGSGVVDGGWGYVTFAYALSWLVIGGYSLSLWLRTPRGGLR
ncbi:MAG TPA: hypothetical protein PKA64_07695 [Myxococcota bacterium]|nr:hypothetical protein [Myxococcota bacterium]